MSSFTSRFGIPVDANRGRETVIQPKLQYRFRVRFINFGGLESVSYGFDATQQITNVMRPNIEFSSKDMGTYAGSVKVFNKPQFRPITLTFRDDIQSTLNKAIGHQLQKQYDFNNGRYAVSAGSAKFSMVVETMDGLNEVRTRDAFLLEGCYINSTEFGALDYASSGVVTNNIVVEYDYLGGFYSEERGLEDAEQLLWYVTSNATSQASTPPTITPHTS